MDTFAKRAAFSHFLFNLIGAIITIPFIGILIIAVINLGGETAHQVANAHLIFNVVTTIILLIFINQFQWIIEKLIPTNEKEIILQAKNLENLKNKTNSEIFSSITLELKNNFSAIIELFNENTVILLSTKTNISKISKLYALVEYVHDEIKQILITVSKGSNNKKDSKEIILLARTSALTQQIAKLAKEMGDLMIFAKENELDFSEEAKKELEDCLTKLTSNLIIVKDNFPNFSKSASIEMAKNGSVLRSTITKSYEEYLKRLSKGMASSGSIFANQLALIQDIESKLREIRKIAQDDF